MSISMEEFDGMDGNQSGIKKTVIEFLMEHPNEAFTSDEIAEQTGNKMTSTSAILNKLKENMMVQHKRPYWTLNRTQQET